ncbi:hypothetical protein PUN28_018254 [Cardiocondyla obscurior]|uniref:Uncharacterized protein n=1 Tax=Cardiocondyla obscurior TaxID=286306 RepID=A0AAW2EJB2_9HYME
MLKHVYFTSRRMTLPYFTRHYFPFVGKRKCCIARTAFFIAPPRRISRERAFADARKRAVHYETDLDLVLYFLEN